LWPWLVLVITTLAKHRLLSVSMKVLDD
jgi:hypothetical protein